MAAFTAMHSAPCTDFKAGFDEPVKTLTEDVTRLSRSGNYYVTPELARNLEHLQNTVNHINLDNEFLSNSKQWRKKFDEQKLIQDKNGK